MKIPNCIVKEINFEIQFAIGTAILGKYTFPNIPLFALNVSEDRVNISEKKYPHNISSHIK